MRTRATTSRCQSTSSIRPHSFAASSRSYVQKPPVHRHPMRILALVALLLVSCTRPPSSDSVAAGTAAGDSASLVRPGIDVFIDDVPSAIRGKRIGLITNHSAIDRAGLLAMDLIEQHEDVQLVALLAPEHG